MQRLPVAPRPGYERTLESQGLSFHALDDYWNESAYYAFTPAQIEILERATQSLHEMCLRAAAHLVETRTLGRLGIPPAHRDGVASSWSRGDYSLYGRFDLAYHGEGPPKLLEYNADTPTSLLESAVCQWYWLEDRFPALDQFNSLHERLVRRWSALPAGGRVHFSSLDENEEDWACVRYLMDTAVQAGRDVAWIAVERIGWDESSRCFVDDEGAPIETLFKLYPWEWMLREEFGANVERSRTRFIEPMWKSMLSCKGILPVLWELFPGNEFLLPAYFDRAGLPGYVRKPMYSREGANVEIVADATLLERSDGPYGAEGWVYQGLADLARFDGRYAVIGSWVVDGAPAGLCVREDTSRITTNTSRFVPHVIH